MIIGQPFNPFGLFVGAFLPNAILQYAGLSPTAKLIYGRLFQFAGQKGVAFPSHETLARELGLSMRSIQRPLRELIDEKFLTVTHPTGADRFAHKTCRYQFLWHPILEESVLRSVPISGKDV